MRDPSGPAYLYFERRKLFGGVALRGAQAPALTLPPCFLWYGSSLGGAADGRGWGGVGGFFLLRAK